METFDITFAEMREKWIDAFSGKTDGILKRNLSVYNTLREHWTGNPNFYGGDPAKMLEYFRNGYDVEMLEDIDISAMPVRKRRRPRFNDCEGDFAYDRFSVGDENCFTEWSKREAIPGITVEFATGFLADVPAKTIADYVRWISSALIAIEAAGVDVA